MWTSFLIRLPIIYLIIATPYLHHLKSHATADTPFPCFSAKPHIKSGILNNGFGIILLSHQTHPFFVVSLSHLLFTYLYSFRIRISCILHHHDFMTTLPHHST